MTDQRIAFVTGGNRGIGLEIACQLAEAGLPVLIGVRSAPDAALDEALQSRGVGELVSHVPVDVTDPDSVDTLADRIEARHGQLDVLVNNAGVGGDGGVSPSRMTDEDLADTLETNLFGALRVTRALMPLLERSPSARVVNVSSTLGSFGDMADPASPRREVRAPAYRVSKAALDAWTLQLAQELKETPIQVNACCPGWIRTRLGGDSAPGSVAEGADTPVWLALQGDDGPRGGLFRDRRRIAW